MSAWIRMVPLAEASGVLKDMYEKVKTPHGTVDNVMRAHSLRPHTMDGHVVLYRSVLHNPANTLPLWFLECVAVATSLANDCDYSFSHHWANARRLLKDEDRSSRNLGRLARGQAGGCLHGQGSCTHPLYPETHALAREDAEGRCGSLPDGRRR